MAELLEPKYAEIIAAIKKLGASGPTEVAELQQKWALLHATLARDFMASFDAFGGSLSEGSRKANTLGRALLIAASVQAVAALIQAGVAIVLWFMK